MPFYADLSSLYAIPTSSYTAPYLSGPYSGHSSLISGSYSRPSSSSYSKPRAFSNRGYKPHLATISETQIAARTIIPRINPPSLLLPSTSNFKITRPVFINTADIDVSVNKYRKFERTAANKPALPFTKKSQEMVTKPVPVSIPQPIEIEKVQENGLSPFMPRIDNMDTRKTIKRERTVVRIHTDHSKENKTKDGNVLLLKPKWRENFEPEELTGKEKKVPVKTPGAKLMEKFLIKDTIKEEEEDKIRSDAEERKRIREENLKLYEDNKKTRKSVKRKQSVKKTPSFHDICRSISSDKISEDLNPAHTILEQRRHSKIYCNDDMLKEMRRNSAEILQEQVLMLDEMLRQQNEMDAQTAKSEEPKPKDDTDNKRKKKIAKKKSNEKIVLPPDDEEEIMATSLQRRPVKKRRSSTASSLDSLIEDSAYDKDTEQAYQSAIRDTSQPEVEKFDVKAKEDPKKSLKSVIEEDNVPDSPKTKRKFAISYTLEEADQKRKTFAKKASESSSTEENEDAAVLKKNLQNMLLGIEPKHLKTNVDTGVIQNAKPQEVVTSDVLQKQPVAAKKGHILLEKNVPVARAKKTILNKEVNNNDTTLLSKPKTSLKNKTVEKQDDSEIDFWSSIDPEEHIQKTREHIKSEQERLQALKWEQEVQKLAELEKSKEEELQRKQKEAEEELKRKQKLEEEEKRKQKLAEEERKRKQKLAEEEEKKKRKAEEERKRKAEEERLRKEAEEEARKLKLKQEEEERQRLQKVKEEEEERLRKEEEARKLKLKQEEEKRLKKQKEEEELKRRRAELEEQKKKLAEATESRRKRLAEEEEKRKRKELEEDKKLKQELLKEEEQRRLKEAEEAERQKSLAEQEKKRKQEEEKRRKLEEELKLKEEEERRKKLDEEKKRKQKEEEEKRKKVEQERKRKEEDEKRKKLEEEMKRKQKEEEERKLKEKLLHEEKVKRRKLQEEMEKKKLLEEARKRREKEEEEARIRREKEAEEERIRLEKEAEEARIRREKEAEKARIRREQEEEEERKRIAEEAARIKAEYEENLKVKEEMVRKMASKRSIVTKFNTVDDPDLEVFTEPEPEPEPSENDQQNTGFVPMQSNRLSQFMVPYQKPEQYEECPVVIMATPKPIRTRHYPKPRVSKIPTPSPPPPPTKEENEEEDDEEDDDDEDSDDTDEDTSGEEESSSEEEYTLERSGADIGKSTSSTDSGFDSSAPGSPANRRHNG